ncbi:MAG: inorganic phosphate transporter [Rickettsiaceae bacterium]|nr:MAG: inorganic phosphate transporter [Rickettsiaceae bacterium]
MEISLIFILCVIALALVFDFTNGFHDAANSIATIVATKVLTPRQAVIWAAFFNFIAFLFFSKLSVATTVGTGLINPYLVNSFLIFAALLAAVTWNLLTWYYGLPSSSSHALIGGLAGAALFKGGITALELQSFTKIILAIVLSPLIGILFGIIATTVLNKLTNSQQEAQKHRWFKFFQLASSAMLSISHGGNDAQKTMGIIAVLLHSTSWLGNEFYVPSWVVITCYSVLALGTLAGGWRIVHTMGEKITKLDRMGGCIVETGAAAVISFATHLGIPVSTTHIVTSIIAGVGSSDNTTGTRWSVMYKIFLTWLLTIPATAIIAGSIMYFESYFKLAH